MPELAALDIVIGAKVDQAIANVDKFNQSIENVGFHADLSTRHSLQFSRGLTELSTQARLGLLNLNSFFEVLRVGAQEFNNIQKETGSTKTALKELGGAIFSEQTLMLLATTVIATFVSKLLSSKKAVDENTKANEEFKKSLFSDAGGEIGKLVVLTNAAKDVNLSMNERSAAVKKLQDQFPDYFANLSKEKILNGDVAAAIQETTKALFERAVVRQKESELGPIAAQIFDLKLEREELEKQEAALKRIAAIAGRTRDQSQTGITSRLFGAGSQDKQALANIEQQIAAIDKQILPLQGKFKGLAQAIIDASEEAGKGIFDDKHLKETGETIAKILAELGRELSFLTAKELNEGLDEGKEKISAIEGAIKKLIDIKVSPGSTLIQKLFGDINDIKFSPENFKIFIDKLQKSIAGEQAPKLPINIEPTFIKEDFFKVAKRAEAELGASKFHIDLPINFNVASGKEIDDIIKKINAAKDSLNSLNTTIKDTISSGLQDFFVSIGDSLANGGNPFEAFANILGEGLKSLGKALIQYGVEVGIIQKVLANPFNPVSPILAIAAGIALEAIGAGLERSLKITGLASGGIIPPGFQNDTFPAFLSSNEAVIPLDKINKFIKTDSGVQVFIPDVKLQGSDLVLVFERQQRKNKRTN